jgi:hypothetical protein
MSDEEFDAALVGACFAAIAAEGWHGLSIAAAAREARLDLARAHARIPNRTALLLRFGAMADRAALAGADPPAAAAPVQELLFDRLMRRIDVLQSHRAGVLALLRALPADPARAAMLTLASLDSMAWILQSAGVPAHGPLGLLRANGLLAVWLWTLRAWQTDDSADLAATMSTLDTALARAAQLARSLPGAPAPEQPAPPPEPTEPSPI